MAYNSKNLAEDMEALPYKLVDADNSPYWDNIYREREIIRERTRLAMGMSLRPEDEPIPVSQGVEESNIDEKYYEPPLMQVISSACNACPENRYEVTDKCMGCLAHPCNEVCPRGAITMQNGHSVIDQTKCVKCGKCKTVCPYDAISHQQRPCLAHCGVNAIHSDSHGRAIIDSEKCVSCGQCMVSCPFGAIADKSQIFQLIRAMQSGRKIIAQVAPSFVGQFGDKVTPDMIKTALKELGFYDVYETAIGADMGAMAEAEHYVHSVATGELPFLLTSCCPSWAMLAKKFFPDLIDQISQELTPMVATARTIKQEHPNAKVVFIGPCAAKKLEAMRRTVRSEVDFVLTFEEMAGIFEARHIDVNTLKEDPHGVNDASADGRNFAVSGGVAQAVVNVINREIKVANAEGLSECRKLMMMAKAGKYNGYLLEGMACPGGCVAGAGTMQSIKKSSVAVNMYAKQAEHQVATGTHNVAELDKLVD